MATPQVSGFEDRSVMTDRALVTVARIGSLSPMDADRLELAQIRGWTCVVPKGVYQPGMLCLFFEPDSFLPASDDRYAFLTARNPVRVHPLTGERGYRIRSIRLRGAYSHGLVMRIEEFPEVWGLPEGTDVTGVLRVVKWEEPLPVRLAGEMRGPFPGWIEKTDELRVQNVPAGILAQVDPSDWYWTEKLDGSSMTVYWDGDLEGVCSRNVDLRETRENLFWRVARAYRLHAWLRSLYPDAWRVVAQGELMGPGVQGNPLGLSEHGFYLFTLQVDGQRVMRADWPSEASLFALPVLDDLWAAFPSDPAARPAALIGYADGLESRLVPGRLAEGLVCRHWRQDWVEDPATGERYRASFKVLSQPYLVR